MNNTERFAALIDQCADKAYNFAYRLAGNEQDARDLVQEAFAHALKNLDRYDPNRPFEPWLNRILKNIYLDGVRRYAYKHTVSLDGTTTEDGSSWDNISPGSDPTPMEELHRKETNELVQKALNSLPVEYRTVITLCDIEQYSYERISQILDCPIGTVRSRIHHGRLLMRKAFERIQYGGRKLRV